MEKVLIEIEMENGDVMKGELYPEVAPITVENFLKLIKQLKQEGLHVAIETTGNYSQDYLEKALPYIDLFLFDIKHINEKKLKEVTGGNLKIIMDNFKYLLKKVPEKVVMRVPVIPGFNDDVIYDIIDLACFLNVKEINLLPYHSLGKNKWEQLQKEYFNNDLKMMNKDELEKTMLEKAGLWLDEGYIFGTGGEGFERFNLAIPRSV